MLEVLLQLRAPWTHHGDTWGLPGGAVADGESPEQAALRELEEETGLPGRLLTVAGSHIQEHPDWSYTTFVAQASHGPVWDHPVPLDRESTALGWTVLAAQPGTAGAASTWEPPRPPLSPGVPQAPLLPALRLAWEELAALLPPPGPGAAAA